MTHVQFTADSIPADVPSAIREMKRAIRQQIGDVEAAFAEVCGLIEQEVEAIEDKKAKGEPIWPVINYSDIEQGRVSNEQVADIHRRGCAIIKGHFTREVAEAWDERLVDYVERNDFFSQYRGPGDDFFGTLAASKPEIYPIYWSHPQVEARQSERMAKVQSFLNRLWAFESEGKVWFDPDQSTMYPDRIRRRPPGTNSQGLGAHTDSGALERWLLPAYQRVFRHIFDGDISRHDPWDAAYRTEVNEYLGGTTLCSAFRTFQGWTALSDMQHDQGVLFTVPIPMAMAYILLRPLQSDVPRTNCVVSPRGMYFQLTISGIPCLYAPLPVFQISRQATPSGGTVTWPMGWARFNNSRAGGTLCTSPQRPCVRRMLLMLTD